MCKRYFVFAIFACLLLSTQLLGLGAPFVLVTDLSGQQILSVNTGTLVVTSIFTLPNSNFEGIVYGPEGSGLSGNKVYVCDPTADKIYRLLLTITSGQPTAAALEGTGIVYDGTPATGPSALHNGQCGRFNSSGDFLVTSKTSGGVWKFAGLGASTSSIPATPVQIISGTDAEGDLTHANNGDLLVLDITTKNVLRSVSPFNSASGLTAGNLVRPTGGIARRNDGQIYVADGGGQNNIKVFGADGSFVGVCGGFGDIPQFIKIAADGTLYVVTSHSTGSGLNDGKLYSVNTSSCVTTLIADLGQSGNPPAIGVAIPPTSTSLTKSFTTSSKNFNFGFSQFLVTNVAVTDPACTAMVKEAQTRLADIQTLIGTIVPTGQTVTPIPFLGEADFGTEFVFTNGGCTGTLPGNFFDFLIAGFGSGAEFNPRIVECDGNPPGPCQLGADGFFPITEFIPGDQALRKPGGGSTFFLANLGLDTAQLGQFCGFQNPLNDSLTGPANTIDPLDPRVPVVSGNTLAIKFKIAKKGAACSSTKTSDYITNALELLSLIRVRGPQGEPENDIASPVSSTSTYVNPCVAAGFGATAICVQNGNKQYSFSLSLNGLPSGVWNLSLTSLTNNIGVEWNFFRIP